MNTRIKKLLRILIGFASIVFFPLGLVVVGYYIRKLVEYNQKEIIVEKKSEIPLKSDEKEASITGVVEI